jgi:hypothetical protein
MAELYEAVLLRAAAVAAAGPLHRTDQAGQEESLHPSSDFLMDRAVPRNLCPYFGDMHFDHYRYGRSVDSMNRMVSYLSPHN